MDTLKDLMDTFLILIDAGASVRLLYCLLRISIHAEEANSYKKKMINVGIFIVLATCCLVISNRTKGYFC